MLGGEPGVISGTVLESPLTGLSGRIKRICSPDEAPTLPPMMGDDLDPLASLTWLDEFHIKYQIPSKIGLIDKWWQRGVNEAIGHWKIRLPRLLDGEQPSIADIAYLAGLRLSADNTSGVVLKFP